MAHWRWLIISNGVGRHCLSKWGKVEIDIAHEAFEEKVLCREQEGASTLPFCASPSYGAAGQWWSVGVAMVEMDGGSRHVRWRKGEAMGVAWSVGVILKALGSDT
jgi:hypothetical protein